LKKPSDFTFARLLRSSSPSLQRPWWTTPHLFSLRGVATRWLRERGVVLGLALRVIQGEAMGARESDVRRRSDVLAALSAWEGGY